jgi:hypothetical protein
MLTTNQKGAVAEAAVILECAKLGIGVARPLGDERYDLVFDLRTRLLRVQCKLAVRRGDVIAVPLYSSRRAADGLRRLPYSRAEVDAFAAYCPDNQACYFFEFSEVEVRHSVQLRLAPARNNQAVGVRWAHDFDFAAKLGSITGAVAQLGERLAGSEEARGSSPLGSTLFHR